MSCIFCSPWFIIVATLIGFKIWIKITTGKYKGMERMNGLTVVVTGANSGVGAEAAKDFARRGARVIMVCRNMQKAENVRQNIIKDTENRNIVLKHIDFTSFSSVRKCAEEILSEESSINILLNNAGMMPYVFTKTRDGIDRLMQTNYFSPFLFTNLLLGRIKESAPSRIITVSSDLHKLGSIDFSNPDLNSSTNSSVAYGSSKLCNILMSNELSDLLSGSGVTSNSVTPGVVLTDINREMPFWMRGPWELFCRYFLKNVNEGAQTLIYACLSPTLCNSTGKYYKDCDLASVSKAAQDKNLAKKLWEHSERIVDLTPQERHY